MKNDNPSTIEIDGEVTVMESRCTGHCCRNVILPFSPEELKSIKDSYKVEDDHTPDVNVSPPDKYWTRRDGKVIMHNYPRKEIETVQDMVIHLGTTTIDPATKLDLLERVNGNSSDHKKDKSEWTEEQLEWAMEKGYSWTKDGKLEVNTYTCKNYDKETSNCTIYKDRPNICREYPRNGSCQYTECAGSCSVKCK